MRAGHGPCSRPQAGTWSPDATGGAAQWLRPTARLRPRPGHAGARGDGARQLPPYERDATAGDELACIVAREAPAAGLELRCHQVKPRGARVSGPRSMPTRRARGYPSVTALQTRTACARWRRATWPCRVARRSGRGAASGAACPRLTVAGCGVGGRAREGRERAAPAITGGGEGGEAGADGRGGRALRQDGAPSPPSPVPGSGRITIPPAGRTGT